MSERTTHLPRRVTWSCTPTKGGKKGTRGRCTSLGSPEGARNEHVLCLHAPPPRHGQLETRGNWRNRGSEGGREGRWLVGRKRPSFAATRPGRHRIPPPRTLPRRKYVRESGDTGSHARTEALETVLESARQLDDFRIFALVVPPHGPSQVNSNRMYPRARILEGTDRRDGRMRRVDEREFA